MFLLYLTQLICRYILPLYLLFLYLSVVSYSLDVVSRLSKQLTNASCMQDEQCDLSYLLSLS